MNSIHWHLVLNHFPIIGSFIAFILLVIGLFFKNDTLRKTALIGLVITTLFAFATMQTGDAAEEAVEHMEGISHKLIHEHEEMAEKAMFTHMITGILSLLTLILIRLKHKWQNLTSWLSLVCATVAVSLMGYAGYLGGEVRHPEAYSTSSASSTDTDGEHEASEEEEHH